MEFYMHDWLFSVTKLSGADPSPQKCTLPIGFSSEDSAPGGQQEGLTLWTTVGDDKQEV